jgi:TolB protein
VRSHRRVFAFLLVVLLSTTIGPVGKGRRRGGGPDPRTDGSQLVFQASGKNSAQNPALSPDGATLLFTIWHRGYNRGAAGIFVTPSSGGGSATAVVDDKGHASVNLPGAAWNAATNRITLSSDRGGSRDEIWTVSPDGSEPRQVTTHTTAEFYIEPSFSPDGQWIVFETDPDVDRGERFGSLWKVKVDGTGLTRLTDGPGTGTDDREPNWSSKDEIVFQRRMRGSADFDLYVITADGTGVRQLTSGPSEDTDPSWNADGTSVVFSSDFGSLNTANVFIIPANGGTPVRVTNDARYSGAPSFSPDGTLVYYEGARGKRDGSKTDIWRIAAPAVP